MTSALRRIVLASLFILTPYGTAQDLIKETQDRLRVEAQRLEVGVSDAISRADQLGPKQPMRAIEILRQVQAELEADKEALTPERRALLLRKIDQAKRAYEDRVGNPAITTPATTGRSDAESRRQLEEMRVRNEMATINDLRKSGKNSEAEQRFAELTARYPKNPAITSGKIISSGTNFRNSYAHLRDTRAKADLRVYNDVLRTSIPEAGDITYPKDWVDRVAKRTEGIKLTEEEKKIMKALNTPITVELEDKTFQDVLDYLKAQTGLPIVVDPRALEDLNITYKSMVSLNVRKVTTRTALKKLLAELNLTYVMKNETIQITTPARAKEMLTTRSYSVADLAGVTNLRVHPLLSQLQAMDTIQRLVVLMTQTVEPESWEVNGKGGLGSITFYAPTMSLIVRQTAEMHYLLGLSGR